jgi:radical SAM superfamily enzyme
MAALPAPIAMAAKAMAAVRIAMSTRSRPSVSRNAPTLREQVIQGMERARKGNKADKFIIYFQPNTNTYAPVHYLKMMYDEALSIEPENIVGLSR